MLRQVQSREARWLLSQLRPFGKWHAISFLCISAASLVSLLDPLIMKWLIDSILPKKNWGLLSVAAGCFLLSYLARLGFQWTGSLLTFRAVQRMVFQIRLSMLEHLQRLSVDYHERTPVGETLFRLEQDVNQVGDLGGDVFPNALRMILMTAFVVTTMLILNWRLTCVILPFLPLFILLRQRYRVQLQACSDAAQKQAARNGAFLQESLSAMVQIQLLSRERIEAGRFVGLSIQSLRANLKRRMSELRFSLYALVIIAAGMTVIIGYGGRQVMLGSLTIGGLVAFYSYLMRLFEPLSTAVELYSRFQRVGASIRRILQVFEASPRVRDQGMLRISPRCVPHVSVNHIHFAYHKHASALHDVNINLAPSEWVALVGASGSGKSTIAKLIARLYDVDQGAVLVGGIDIRDLRLGSLRSTISFVHQDAVLLQGTLRDNILAGNPRAGFKELERAAHIAQLAPIINKHPDGLDQPLEPLGRGLSGGERQRVALARAILQDHPVLILDEATSALDAPTEEAILLGLNEIRDRRSILMISHRITAAELAHRVIFLEGGRIMEQGAHRELLRSSSRYSELWRRLREDPSGSATVQPSLGRFTYL
jgi:ABC-type multidrug transport system fused ATPase/permease subunit